MSENNQRDALHVTDKSKNATFIGCDIQGAKIEGENTIMIKTRILNNFAKKHPAMFKGIMIALISGGALLFVEYGFLK